SATDRAERDHVDVPDPQSAETFARSKLDWTELARPPHAELLAWYRELIALRHARPELSDPRLSAVAVTYDEQARWLVVTRGKLRVVANLGGSTQSVPLGGRVKELCTASDGHARVAGSTAALGPQSVAIIDVAEV
ncbi:MAG: DUF3459 domain-containing protein, partial [Haloechinothrix sp.]